MGGQPTVGLDINFAGIARALGYKNVYTCDSATSLRASLLDAQALGGPALIEVKVKKGSRKDLGRPTATPPMNKVALMHFLQEKG